MSFSQDTLRFDTVFTSYGSVTMMFTVRNESKTAVKINEISLRNGGNSPFRLNIDGDTMLVVKDKVIRAKDSIFVFVKVTIDPDNENNPFEVADQIVFTLENVSQNVELRAFGQNAYYHLPEGYIYGIDTISGDTTYTLPFSIADCTTAWATDKPHIIYGYLVVYTGDQLVLNAGTRIHLAPEAGIWVYTGGSLKCNGTLGNEVLFQGMRLDHDYFDMTGQWDRIWLSAGSIDNQMDYTIIKNGRIGLLVDTNYNSNPTLTIKNSVIDNMQYYGMVGQGAKIRGENLLVSNCGENLAALTLGGDYSFEFCTFANYFRQYGINRTTPSVILNDYYKSTGNHLEERPLNASFKSCIIYGNQQEEISLDLKVLNSSYNFNCCLLKSSTLQNNSHHSNCLFNSDPKFNDIENHDFDIIDITSAAFGKGESGYGSVAFDLKGRSRAYYPTIGCYECIPFR
ncbi:hypothetical protein FACS1894180_2840 [Bacteroidia bacterium]|nr:hypothetical protein FACS1894178_8610 [Bacteroidia bacterium]GHV43516.1 hypothetical protein FACS1894180_2840 [Bacteroidia bacterium]